MLRRVMLAVMAGALFMPAAGAQATRVGLKPKPNLTLGNSLTVTCAPCSVNFALVRGGIAVGTPSVAVTMSWTGISLIASAYMYAYFASPTAALSGGTPISNIPSSAVLGQMSTGTPTSYTPFTQTGAFGGAGSSLVLYSTAALLSLGGTRTDTLNLEIDLSSLPQQPAAVYSGTLILQAQEF